MLRLARPLSHAARRSTASKLRTIQAPVRGYAERNDSLLSSDPGFRPEVPQQGVVKSTTAGSAASTTSAAAATTAAAGPVPVLPPVPTGAAPTATTSIPPQNIPKQPPPPPPPSHSTTPLSASPPPSPPPSAPTKPPASKAFRRLRLLFYLTILSALGYGGSVFFALRNDNFHDFFTEYVPFGEDAVLYFEERAFHKKFPNAKANVYRTQNKSTTEDKKITIPHHSGLSWKPVAEDKSSDVSQRGKHMSAVDDKIAKEEAKQQPDDQTTKQKSAVVDSVKASASNVTDAATSKVRDAKDAVLAKTKKSEPKAEAAFKAAPAAAQPKTSDNRVPLIAPVTAISPVTVPNGEEDLVQDLVKIVNDMITVVNADGSENANRYSAPLQKAKDAVVAAASKVQTLRDAERTAAEERIKDAHREFDQGARDLLQRFKTEQAENDTHYREEFEAERAKIADQYEKRLQAEVQRTQELWEQKLKNELSEHGLAMKKKFVQDIQGLVETERDGRLSKLTDLSSNVDNLTQLTSNWNGIIDANLATQKLQVAVDTVRAAIQDANAHHKPTPFVREMAALKLVADSDPLVDAAVASINPSAYQKGIPSSAQLVDRFRRVASEVRKASLLPEDAGIASHAASLLLSRVMFKKQGVPQGDDVESILTRTETLLEEGDLDNAAREMNELKGWAGVLSKDWLNDARKVLEVKQALDVIETEARLQCLRVE